MSPDRKYQNAAGRVEEFYWAGGYVVYINNRSSELSFEGAKAWLDKQAEILSRAQVQS